MERLESTVEFDETSKEVKSKKPSNGKKKDKPKAAPSGEKKALYCLLHGECGHTTDECNALQREAKRIKSGNGSSEGKSDGGSKNKTWSKKASEEKAKADGMMAALVKKQVKKAMKKHKSNLAAYASKKRKESDDSESDSSCDLAAFDLKDFNYEDMENLKIDDDEVAV
jgi:hypothetical protein